MSSETNPETKNPETKKPESTGYVIRLSGSQIGS